jgi:hypothetical protein
MRNTTESKELLNPPVHCADSKHTVDVPEHMGFVALDFPFGKKKVDFDSETVVD